MEARRRRLGLQPAAASGQACFDPDLAAADFQHAAATFTLLGDSPAALACLNQAIEAAQPAPAAEPGLGIFSTVTEAVNRYFPEVAAG